MRNENDRMLSIVKKTRHTWKYSHLFVISFITTPRPFEKVSAEEIIPHLPEKTFKSLWIFFFFLNQNKYQHPLSFKWGQLIHASTCSSPLEDTISTYYNQDSYRLASDHIWEQSSLTMFKSHPDNHDAWLKGNDTLIFVIYR